MMRNCGFYSNQRTGTHCGHFINMEKGNCWPVFVSGIATAIWKVASSPQGSSIGIGLTCHHDFPWTVFVCPCVLHLLSWWHFYKNATRRTRRLGPSHTQRDKDLKMDLVCWFNYKWRTWTGTVPAEVLAGLRISGKEKTNENQVGKKDNGRGRRVGSGQTATSCHLKSGLRLHLTAAPQPQRLGKPSGKALRSPPTLDGPSFMESSVTGRGKSRQSDHAAALRGHSTMGPFTAASSRPTTVTLMAASRQLFVPSVIYIFVPLPVAAYKSWLGSAHLLK